MPEQLVVAIAADEQVVPGTAVDLVVAVAAVNDVVITAAAQIVGARAAKNEVASAVAIHHIVAGTRVNVVIAVAAGNIVIAVFSDGVFARPTGNRSGNSIVFPAVAVNRDRRRAGGDGVVAGAAVDRDAGDAVRRARRDAVIAIVAVGDGIVAVAQEDGVIAHAAVDFHGGHDSARVNVIVTLTGVLGHQAAGEGELLLEIAPLDFNGFVARTAADVLDDEPFGVVVGVNFEAVRGAGADVQVQIAADDLGQHRLGTSDVEFQQRDGREAPRLINAEEEQINLQIGFEEQADGAADVEDAARVLLGVGDDFAHAHLAVVIYVVEVEVERDVNTGLHADLDDEQADRSAGEDFTGQRQFGLLVALGVEVQHVEAVQDVEEVFVLGRDELLDAVGVVAKADVNVRADAAAKLRVERRVDRDFLRVGELELERRHAPLDQPHRLADEEVEQLGRVVEDRDAEVVEAARVADEAGCGRGEARTCAGAR